MKLNTILAGLAAVPIASALLPSRALPFPAARSQTASRSMTMNLAADILKLVGGSRKELTDADAREKYGVQLPKYESIAKDGYELRRYQPMTIVQTP